MKVLWEWLKNVVKKWLNLPMIQTYLKQEKILFYQLNKNEKMLLFQHVLTKFIIIFTKACHEQDLHGNVLRNFFSRRLHLHSSHSWCDSLCGVIIKLKTYNWVHHSKILVNRSWLSEEVAIPYHQISLLFRVYQTRILSILYSIKMQKMWSKFDIISSMIKKSCNLVKISHTLRVVLSILSK